MKRSQLDLDMKMYEKVGKIAYTPRIPLLIRIDGKAFHTFTKQLKKPFDELLVQAMQYTTKFLCENIQGCKMGYTQSDEISILIYEPDKKSEQWLKGVGDKLTSITASMATQAFNSKFRELVDLYEKTRVDNCKLNPNDRISNTEKYQKYIEDVNYVKKLKRKLDKALFDSRPWILPKEEVLSYFTWRQRDAMKNSVSMVARAYFSHKQLEGKSSRDMKEMLLEQYKLDIETLLKKYLRGSCVIKQDCIITSKDNKGNPVKVTRKKWVIDNDIPIFTQNPSYINKYLYVTQTINGIQLQTCLKIENEVYSTGDNISVKYSDIPDPLRCKIEFIDNECITVITETGEIRAVYLKYITSINKVN